ncbi:MAG: NAD(+) synthase [Clostridia bacterium]|nr:NAD(+) synthase [Clostridia bacterium]
MSNVSEFIKKIKNEKGMTAKELSEKSGIPLGTLNKILSASTKSVKAETLSKISDALGQAINISSDNPRVETTKNYPEGFLRVAAVTPDLRLGDISYNTEEIKRVFEKSAQLGAGAIVFPELCFSGYTLSDLFYSNIILEKCQKSLFEIVDFSRNYDLFAAVGCPVLKEGKIYNCAVAFCKGEILGVVPKTYLPEYDEFYERRQFSPAENENSTILIGDKSYPFGNKLIFINSKRPSQRFSIELCEDLWVCASPSTIHSLNGANVILNLSASNEVVFKADKRKDFVRVHSEKCACAYVYSDAGQGESTTDLVFGGHNIIAENGKVIKENLPFTDEKICVADIDTYYLDFIRSKKWQSASDIPVCDKIYFSCDNESDGKLREFSRYPFIPEKNDERRFLAFNTLELQTRALSARLERSGAKTAVIGVSGGLDSALALIVCYEAFKLLKRPVKNIIAVTMPCFGTSDRTKNNSVLLAESLGISVREINISSSVRSHLLEIGHDGETPDVTFENAQARERTQVLMDISNMTGGLVVGTGDMSELALGWATYNGDHMSMYGVNSSIPKTLVREIVRAYGERGSERLKNTLLDILDTPVSPELVPVGKGGEISQKTEDIVGPYVLHDFFLYHFISSGYSPSKIYYIALRTFEGEFDGKTIYKWLDKFIRRFFSQQFKRSCSPDGVKTGKFSLSPRGDWRMPSDCSPSVWLKDLEKVKP